jgi:hypothetical protein
MLAVAVSSGSATASNGSTTVVDNKAFATQNGTAVADSGAATAKYGSYIAIFNNATAKDSGSAHAFIKGDINAESGSTAIFRNVALSRDRAQVGPTAGRRSAAGQAGGLAQPGAKHAAPPQAGVAPGLGAELRCASHHAAPQAIAGLVGNVNARRNSYISVNTDAKASGDQKNEAVAGGVDADNGQTIIVTKNAS